jgi:maltoporin
MYVLIDIGMLSIGDKSDFSHVIIWNDNIDGSKQNTTRPSKDVAAKFKVILCIKLLFLSNEYMCPYIVLGVGT